MKPIKQEIVHLDKQNRTALVKNSKGESYPVKMDKYIADGVRYGDLAIVTKSPVSGEWIMIDYDINTLYNKEIDMFYANLPEEDNTTLEDWL